MADITAQNTKELKEFFEALKKYKVVGIIITVIIVASAIFEFILNTKETIKLISGIIRTIVGFINNNWFIGLLLILLLTAIISLFIALFIRLLDKYVFKTDINPGQCTRNLKEIKEFNQISKQISDLIFTLALEGKRFIYKENKQRYVEELERLESDTGFEKTVYVITNDMTLDLYSVEFSAIVKENLKSSSGRTEYKYIIPKSVKIEAPEDVKKKLDEVRQRFEKNKEKFEKNNLKFELFDGNGWPKLELSDIYRFKYYCDTIKNYIYENELDADLRNEKYNEWIKLRSQLFLEIEPEVFTIFGPSSERTIYLHKLEREEELTVSLFLKSKEFVPSKAYEKGEKFHELDMITIDLKKDHPAHGKLRKTISDFDNMWTRIKNTNLEHSIIPLLDVPFVLEEKAQYIWVMSPDLIFDNTFVPIRNIVSRRLSKYIRFKEDRHFKYKFIIPYPDKDEEKQLIIAQHLSVFFKNHNVHTSSINDTLKNKFIFVSSEVLSRFSIFGELTVYKDIPMNGKKPKNILCLFPPVRKESVQGDSKAGVVKKEIDKVILDLEFNKDIPINYAEFALILNDTFTETFVKHVGKIAKRIKTDERKNRITYYKCTYKFNGENENIKAGNFEFKLDE
jgi:hypothetical protein